jgi:phosphopantetheinyl transferase (holo-ACP synthase)
MGAKLNLIDVSYREDGSPILTYQGKEYEVSIAHDGGYAISVVIIP